MPDDDMVLVRRDDLRAVLEEEYVRVDRIERLAAAVNDEAATVEYDMFDGKCHGRVVGPWTTQETP